MLSISCFAEFIPPFLLSDPVLFLEQGIYDKINDDILVIKVRVLADSTAFAESIEGDIDIPLSPIDDQIAKLLFVPAMRDSVAVEAVFIQMFNIKLSKKVALEHDGQELSKAMIQERISEMANVDYWRRKDMENHSDDSYYSNLFYYRHNHHYIMSLAPEWDIYKHGFSQPTSIFASANTIGSYLSFDTYSTKGYDMVFTRRDYEYLVPVSEIQASLGDYESKYAVGKIQRNRLLGIPNLWTGFSFLVQSGSWEEVLADNTSFRYALGYALGSSEWNLEYENYDRVEAMSKLLSPYWIDQSFAIDYQAKAFSITYSHPFINLGFRNLSESASAPLFSSSIKKRVKQFYIGTDQVYEFGTGWQTKASLNFEHYLYEESINSLAEEAKNRLRIDLDADYQQWSISSSARFNSNKEGSYSFSGARQINDNLLGLRMSGIVNPQASFLRMDNPYLANSELLSSSYQFTNDYGLFGSLNCIPHTRVKASAGQRLMRVHYPVVQPTQTDTLSYDLELPYIEIDATNQFNWDRYELKANTFFTWYQDDEKTLNLPSVAYQGQLEIAKYLDHNNRLFAGIGYIGHSSMTIWNLNNRVIDNSLVLDLWTGFRITDSFEMTLSAKNLFDNAIYGIYPLPPSLHLGLRWFFVN